MAEETTSLFILFDPEVSDLTEQTYFLTQQEAEKYKKPTDKIIERDGCPISTALALLEYTRWKLKIPSSTIS